MSTLWVHMEELEGAGPRTLSADEARHVVARRLRPGDEVVVFDAMGRTAPARVARVARRSVEVEITAPVSNEDVADERAASGLVVASAIPKGDRLGVLLGMLVQLGVEAWQPVVWEQSVVRRLDVVSPRLRRIVIESCKVARRPRAMTLLEPRTLESVLDEWAGRATLLFGDRGAPDGDHGLWDGGGASGDAGPGRIVFFVGPEAGVAVEERGRLEAAGARGLALARTNLRIETAAVAAAARFAQRRVGETGHGRDARADPAGAGL